jgi:hypothetical protein
LNGDRWVGWADWAAKKSGPGLGGPNCGGEVFLPTPDSPAFDVAAFEADWWVAATGPRGELLQRVKLLSCTGVGFPNTLSRMSWRTEAGSSSISESLLEAA